MAIQKLVMIGVIEMKMRFQLMRKDCRFWIDDIGWTRKCSLRVAILRLYIVALAVSLVAHNVANIKSI